MRTSGFGKKPAAKGSEAIKGHKAKQKAGVDNPNPGNATAQAVPPRVDSYTSIGTSPVAAAPARNAPAHLFDPKKARLFALALQSMQAEGNVDVTETTPGKDIRVGISDKEALAVIERGLVGNTRQILDFLIIS